MPWLMKVMRTRPAPWQAKQRQVATRIHICVALIFIDTARLGFVVGLVLAVCVFAKAVAE